MKSDSKTPAQLGTCDVKSHNIMPHVEYGYCKNWKPNSPAPSSALSAPTVKKYLVCCNCGAVGLDPTYTFPCGDSYCWHCHENRGRHDDCEKCNAYTTDGTIPQRPISPEIVEVIQHAKELLEPCEHWTPVKECARPSVCLVCRGRKLLGEAEYQRIHSAVPQPSASAAPLKRIHDSTEVNMTAQQFYSEIWIKQNADDPRGDWPIRFAEAYHEYLIAASQPQPSAGQLDDKCPKCKRPKKLHIPDAGKLACPVQSMDESVPIQYWEPSARSEGESNG